MSDELWNQKLTRENIRDFYMSTVVMVYSSCYGITKEATRCENAIIKSYLDIYSKRNNIAGDRVIYEFGDILLANAKNIVAQYPLPADMTFEDRLLDEYTRNSMLEKILSKIDSKGFKAMEFINTDVKNKAVRRPKQMRKLNDLFQITPLLILEVIILAVVIWIVSYAAVTLPYRHSELISDKVNESATIQDQFNNALAFYPFKIQTNLQPRVWRRQRRRTASLRRSLQRQRFPAFLLPAADNKRHFCIWGCGNGQVRIFARA